MLDLQTLSLLCALPSTIVLISLVSIDFAISIKHKMEDRNSSVEGEV